MLTSFSNNAITAKVKAMYGKRLTEEQYRELAREKSMADVVKYLKENTAYSEILSTVQPTMIHRGQLENLLQRDRFLRYLRLMHFNQDVNNDLYRYIIHEFEIQQILQMIRLLNSNRPQEYITMLPSFIGKHSCYDFMELANVRTFDDLLKVLVKTPYRAILLPFKPAVNESIDYTACEMALYAYFYKNLSDLIDKNYKARPKVRKQLHEIINVRIELTNITNIYRIKRYYPDVDLDYLKKCLLPGSSRISAKQMAILLEAEDDKQFIKMLSQSSYAKYFGDDDFKFIEYRTDCIRYNLNKRYLRYATDAVTAFIAYMVLTAIELNNITNIIEGIQYGTPTSDIEGLLIL